MKKKIATVLLAAMTVSMVAGCGNQPVEGTAAIKVNKDIITQEAIDARYEQTCAMYRLDPADANVLALKATVAEGMIDERLLLQEADKRGIKGNEEEAETLKQEVRDYYNSDEEFEASLAEQKMTAEQFAQMAGEQVIFNALQQYIAKDIAVDAKGYYDENQEQFAQGERVKASHILVDTEEEAQAIIDQLDDGADFAQLATEKSTDAASAAGGGDLGYFTREKMVVEFSDAAFSQEVGTYSKSPVKSDFGYHIIFVSDKQPEGIQPFSEVEQSLITRLTNEKINEAFYGLVDSLREKAEIEYIIDQAPAVQQAPAENVPPADDVPPTDDAAKTDQ